MRPNNWRCRVVGLALLIVVAPMEGQSRPGEQLGWMSGCWERRTASAVIEEIWSSARGGILVGTSKTTVRDTVREYEFLRIYSEGDTLVLNALPSRQRPAWFRATPPYDSSVVFSNPTHDFPQRIIYRRVADSLHARIEGTRNGESRAVDYRYARSSCK